MNTSLRQASNRSSRIWWVLTLPLVLTLLIQFRFFAGALQSPAEYYQMICFDFHARWVECAYLLRGIDPMAVIADPSLIIPELGAPLNVGGTVPWAYSLGLLANLGFLPYSLAKPLGLFLFVGTILLFSVLAAKAVYRLTGSFSPAVCCGLLAFCSPYLTGAVHCCNYGFLWGLALCVMAGIVEDHPWLAGVLLLLASLKPQLSGLFFIVLLLERRWKPLLVAGVGIVLGWLTTALMCRTSPLVLLTEIFMQGTQGYEAEGGFFGFFTALIQRGAISRTAGLLLSAGVGVVLTVLLWLLLRRILPREQLLSRMAIYSVPAILSVSWFYRSPNDLSVLVLPMLTILLVLWQQTGGRFRFSVFALMFSAVVYWIQPNAVNDFLFYFFDCYIPGSALDDLVLSNALCLVWSALLIPAVLCLADCTAGRRFRQSL